MVRGTGSESTRRRQFSSCDLCRKSRIACDAAQLQDQQLAVSEGRASRRQASGIPDAIPARVQCTNCSKRAVPCTYEWIQSRASKNATAAVRQSDRPKIRRSDRRSVPNRSRTAAATGTVTSDPEPAGDEGHLEDSLIQAIGAENARSSHLTPNAELSRQTEAVALHDQLWKVFTLIFEPVLTLWTGPDCSPYVVPDHMSSLTMLQLVVSLDWATCEGDTSHASARHVCPRCDRDVRLALIASVHAFSLRWLPLVTDSAIDSKQLRLLGDRLWHNAKSRVLSIFDKLSYQTVLALYLFGLTPICEAVSMDVENAHSAGEVSVDMALRHVHRLRVKRRDLRFSGTNLSVGRRDGRGSGTHVAVNEDFIHAENMMYWAGVVFDTSSAMTRGCPSILCSGVFGFEEEPIFRLMKARVQLFHESTEPWRQHGFVPTSQSTLYIVHRASTWKGYTWKIIGALREAINHGYDESVITRLRVLISQALERFDRTFKPLLTACEHHVLFLSKDAQLCYYLLQLHYHMGLLLLCSIAVSIERLNLVPNFDTLRRESVHAIFSTLSFGLRCQVALNQDGTQRNRRLSSLISLDPYPHHILASLQLSADVLLVYLERDEIAQDSFDSSCHIVFEALDELPQSLQSVQRVKKLLHEKLDIHGEHLGMIPNVRHEHQVHHMDAMSETNGSGSSSSINMPDVDEAGHSCLSKTLFARPAVWLRSEDVS
ncbi:uncharacterized protein TRIREDRAFT_107858 [Trichoderma reesei QM6a]|uniref:Predicted protein n=2 Tax=Hypocrea jecorina TaxID=51453 RepID=G0RKJ7_HYPJQ|nr:uncharacterized protein TRIREDRAFT_107858 [Trichoderma reesei QM6a]EGR48438.1 predicted protein [Trichoderma reesei QM6a]